MVDDLFPESYLFNKILTQSVVSGVYPILPLSFLYRR